MTQLNDRKEPTFGKTNEGFNLASESTGKGNTESPNLSLSLHSNKTPGYTFTPVMKRPVTTTEQLANQEKTLEEQAMSKEQVKTTESNSHTPRSNGGFAFAPVKEDNAENNADTLKKSSETDAPKIAAVNSNIERVIPNVANAAKEKVAKVPSKYRRLLIVLLLLLALLLAIFLLKPKTPETVETLQEQGSSLPIEFRPVNEEEAKRAEEQAKALQEHTQDSTQLPTENANNANTVENTTNVGQTDTATPTVNEMNKEPEALNEAQTKPTENTQQTTLPAVKPATIEPAKKPQISGSVIHQPETTSRKETTTVVSKSTQVTKVENKSTQVKPPVVTKVEKVVVKQPAKVAEHKASVATTASVASKTLTVPKGVSLMQVFRDNQLNISDVNAMSKVNNIVSNLKVGEKVTVQLDKNSRVTEMKIGSGGRFIRQADGSYIYK